MSEEGSFPVEDAPREALVNGTVAVVNAASGMVAVLTEDGYSIIEMLGDDPPDVGDEIRWKGSTPLPSR
jgi:hypothetical protein